MACMMRVLMLILALFVAMPAQAVRHANLTEMSDAAKRAEYHRLSGELQRHAERGVWAGAEAAYRALLALESSWVGDSPLQLRDHTAGAWAATMTNG